MPLELPKDDQELPLHYFNDVLLPKWADGKRFSSATEIRFPRPEIKMPHVRTSVLQSL